MNYILHIFHLFNDIQFYSNGIAFDTLDDANKFIEKYKSDFPYNSCYRYRLHLVFLDNNGDCSTVSDFIYKP